MGTFTKRLLGAIDVFSGGSISAHFLKGAIGLEGTDSKDEGKYRRMTQKSIRDLTPMKYAEIQKMAFYQWQRYPLAKRLIEILTDFCMGEEFHVAVKIMKRNKDEADVDTERKDGQQVWDDFYEDPVNDFETDISTIIQDLFLNGELVLPVFVNTVNGKTRIGYIDPAFIERTECVKNNARKIDRIFTRPAESTEVIPFKVIRYDDSPESETYGKLVGDVFFFRNNYVTTQTRGHSELTELLDWIDSFDQFLFGTVEGFNARNSFFYDLTMEGKTEEELKAVSIDAPTQGEVKIHNEKAIWEVKTPDLKAVDASVAVNLIKTSIVGSKGYPNHWFGDGSDANLATAEQMAIPTVRMVKRKQRVIKNMMKMMALFVLQNGVDHGEIQLAEDEYFDIDVSMFDIERKDSAVVGTAFTALVNAMAVATSKGWMSDDTAKKVVDGMLNLLGVEVDPNETPEDIKAKAAEKLAEEALTTKTPINDFMNEDGKQNGENKNAGKNTSVD